MEALSSEAALLEASLLEASSVKASEALLSEASEASVLEASLFKAPLFDASLTKVSSAEALLRAPSNMPPPPAPIRSCAASTLTGLSSAPLGTRLGLSLGPSLGPRPVATASQTLAKKQSPSCSTKVAINGTSSCVKCKTCTHRNNPA